MPEGHEEDGPERLFRRCEEPLEPCLVEHHPPNVGLPQKLDAAERVLLQLA
ncbi:MAG TPA: hypothetical protein VLT82_12225 [Myxococcaceae bacterium]|nr:hypothetical protein [Myxococcaceae bacterium]